MLNLNVYPTTQFNDLEGIFVLNNMNENPLTSGSKYFSKGEYIYTPGEISDKVYYIIEGRVKISSHNSSGKEVTKAILNSGEIFGELSMIGQKKRCDFAYAMEGSEVVVLSSMKMKSLLNNDNKLSFSILKILGSRILEVEQRLESLVFRNSRSRIVECLLELVKKRGQRVGYEWVVRKFITHQEIANLTATSRQTVTTVLNELRAQKLLTFNRKRLLIRDLENLSAQVA
ncbi:MAG: Crp/Fnr family transcriptional regulator [Bacteroidota bacterium]